MLFFLFERSSKKFRWRVLKRQCDEEIENEISNCRWVAGRGESRALRRATFPATCQRDLKAVTWFRETREVARKRAR